MLQRFPKLNGIGCETHSSSFRRKAFPGNRNDPIPGGVTYWFKQDEIHAATHVHQGPAFLP